MNQLAAIDSAEPSSGAAPWSKDAAALLDALPVAIVVLGADGRVSRINPAAVSLLGNLERGVLWREVIPDIIIEPPEGGLRLPSGRYVSVGTSPLTLEPGQIIVLNDVTENRRLQDLISRHRRLSAMGELAAKLAHQIRTPLATVTLYLSRLSQLPQVGQHAGIVDKCLERVRHLNDLISDMLRLARGGANDTETLSLVELLSAIRNQVTPVMDRVNARLEVRNSAPGVHVRGNKTLLVGMFENLITNGLQAAGEDARVHLTAAMAAPRVVVISVADNGPGIAETEREKIFEPFFTTRPQGTGLGLAVVRSIAQDHRAHITVHSEPGAGARFDIVFPVVDTCGPPARNHGSPAPSLPISGEAS